MDTIFLNGNFRTMDPSVPTVQAVAVKNHRFAAIGSNQQMLALKTAQSVIIDLQGKTAVPGFHEGHIHLLNYAYSLNKVDLSACKSIPAVIETARTFLSKASLPRGAWFLGRGWNQIHYPKNRELTAADLDKISTTHPICFSRICEHVCVANTKAMELANISAATAQPTGGSFDVDAAGNPTGIFRETARYMIYDIIPDITRDEMKEMIVKAANIAASFGITSVQSDDFEAMPSKDYEMVIAAYQELAAEKRLPVRVYQQCLLPELDRLKEFLAKGYCTGQGDEYYRIGPLKLLTDGSLGARTAYLNAPYSDDPTTCGIPVFTQDELNSLAVTAHCGGMQLVFHAIGDGAMDMCFHAFEAALAAKPAADPRFGIIHLQITTPEIIDKFEKLNVIAHQEPICLNNDIHMAESRLGARVNTAYHYKDFFTRGIPVAISSDCPVDSLNPMKNIYVGVNRKDYAGFPSGGWYPQQCLSVEENLYAFTMGSAYASFDEKEKGSISVGKLADFVVLSDDPIAVDPMDIQNIETEITVMGGNITYQKT